MMCGDFDRAIQLARETLDELQDRGGLIWIPLATAVLVEALLQRGGHGDVEQAHIAIDQLAAAPTEQGVVLQDIWLLRLRALLARAHGDTEAYADLRDRYRDMAKTLGFEGHIAWAEAMP
jgi:adenylate cyclase